MIIVSSGEMGYIYDWCFVKRLRWRTDGKKSSQYIYSTGTKGQISACAVYESVQRQVLGRGKESFPLLH